MPKRVKIDKMPKRVKIDKMPKRVRTHNRIQKNYKKLTSHRNSNQ